MLGKLIKYEFKASGMILLPIYIATLILSILIGITSKFPEGLSVNSRMFGIVIALTILLYAIFVFAGIALSIGVSVYRFKSNLFGTEGYLMHTLPVKTHSLILSKLIVALIYEFMGVLVAVTSGVLITVFAAEFNLSPIVRGLAYTLRDNIKFIAEGIPAVLLSLIATNIMLFAALAVGYMANSKKFIKSVGVYILFTFAVSIFDSIALCVQSIVSEQSIADYAYSISIDATFITEIITSAIYCTVFFIITNHCIKNKLNLQ